MDSKKFRPAAGSEKISFRAYVDHWLTPGLLLRKFSSGKTRTRKFLQCFHPRKTRTRKFSHIFSSGENTHSKSFHPKYFISSSLHPYNPYCFHPKYFISSSLRPYNPYFFHPNKIFLHVIASNYKCIQIHLLVRSISGFTVPENVTRYPHFQKGVVCLGQHSNTFRESNWLVKPRAI